MVLDEYDYPGLNTIDGVVKMGRTGKGAWLKDSEENILHLSPLANY